MPLGKGALLIVSQILGSIVAAVVAHELTPGVTPGGVLAVQTSLAPGVSLVQGVFIECLVTCLLTLTVMMIAVEKHRATFMAPLVIGVALTIGHMISVNLTGAGMNPVRSFGPAVASGTFVPEHWIYCKLPSALMEMAHSNIPSRGRSLPWRCTRRRNLQGPLGR